MRPRKPYATTAPSAATTAPKSEPLYGEATLDHVLPASPDTRIVPASPTMASVVASRRAMPFRCLSSASILRALHVFPPSALS